MIVDPDIRLALQFSSPPISTYRANLILGQHHSIRKEIRTHALTQPAYAGVKDAARSW